MKKQQIDASADGPACGQRRLARQVLAAAVGAAFGTSAMTAWAQLPAGGVPVHGSAAIATEGSRMTVTSSPNAVLDWQAFSIGARNSVHFAQQSAASQVLNRVVGNDTSAILGSLSSNGGVWLVNPHGVLFGSSARIDVGGLVASTLPISNEDFLAGRFRFDSGALPGGQVLNQGEITTSFGGRVWLMGDSVRNDGLVHSPGGNIVLAAGRSIELVDSGMPNVTVRVTAPGNAAVNLGALLATGGGSIDVHGGIVNQQGIVRADSIGTDPAGRVVIAAQGDVQVGAASETGADARGSGSGGRVLVESAEGAALVQGTVSATSNGGGGGSIHLLGKQVGIYGQARIDASSATGAGKVLAGGDYQGANRAVRNAEAVYLGPAASVRANATAGGDGGKVILWGNEAARVFGTIEARGGPDGGNGGLVETSGGFLDARPVSIDVASQRGTAGTWLLDPGNMIINEAGPVTGVGVDGPPDFNVTSVADDAVFAATSIVQALQSGTNVVLRTGGDAATTQAGNITVASNIVVTGTNTVGSLTLEAHNDIVLNPGIRIASESGPMPVTLTADIDENNTGSVRLSEGTAIATRGGNLFLLGANQGSGPGDGFRAVGSALDAGNGLVGLGGNSVDIAGNSTVTGGGVGIVGNRTTVTGSTLTATGGNLVFTADGPVNTGTALLADTTLAHEQSGAIAFNLQALDLVNTRVTTGGTVNIDATAANVTAGSEVSGRNVRITARTLNVFDSQLATTDGGLDLRTTAPGTGGGAVVLRNAALAASVTSVEDSSPLSIVAQSLDLTNTTLHSTGGIEVLAPVVTIGANSELAGSNVAIASQRITVADSRIDAVAGGVTLFASTTTGTGGASLANITIGAHSSTDASLGNIGVLGDVVAMTDADLTASGDVAIAGTSAAIDNAGSVADIHAAGLDITSGTTRLDSVNVVASRAQDAIVIRTNSLTSTASRLSTPAGRWLVYLNGPQAGFPAAALGDLDYTFVQVDAGGAPPILSGIGNNGIVMAAPLAIQVKVDAGRPYDGTALATFSQALSHNAGNAIAVQPVNGGGIARGTFDSRNAGVGKPILYEGEGAYFAVRTANGSPVYGATQTYVGDITPKAITAAGLAAAGKVYDATRTAALSGSLAGVVEGDDVTLAGATGLFDTKNAGTGKTVTIAGTALAGTDAGNYALSGGATTTADITPRPISAAGITAAGKVYDGTRVATLSGTLAESLAGDDLSLSGGTGLFDDKNAGAGKAVAMTGGTLAGADAGNYILLPAYTTRAGIAPRPITTAGITASDKVYDGTPAATLSGALSEALPGDSLALEGATGRFADRHAGAAKIVTIGGGALAGADAANYILSGGQTTRAAITPRPIGATGIAAADKVYDGTRTASLSGTLAEALDGDNVSLAGATGEFDTKNAGAGKTVVIAGGALAGTDAGNYTLRAGAGTSADITPRAISAAGIAAADKVYDGTRTATLSGRLSEVLGNDDVLLASATGSFDNRNAGANKPVAIAAGPLTGADAGNYVLAGQSMTTATIAPRPIGTSGITAVDRVYDGTRMATLSGTLADAIAGDAVTLAGATGQFDSRNAGTNKLVAIAGGALSGADAANYVLLPGGSARAAIAPRPLAIGIAGPVVKEYDATSSASVGASQFVLEGVIAGDTIGVNGPAQGTYDTAGAGQGKNITVTGQFQVSGTDAVNYRVGTVALAGTTNLVTATAIGNTGAITPATLVYTAAPAVREPGLPVTGLAGTVTGFKGADSLASATIGVLAWQSGATAPPQPGVYPVTGAGLSAVDYVLVQAPGNATALQITLGNSPGNPTQQAQGDSAAAIAAALRSALPEIDARRAGSGLLDISNPAIGKTYGAVRIGAMSQEELIRMIAERRAFKRKLFADAIYKLDLDPGLADVQPCATVIEASSGACRITPNQLDLAGPDTRLAALAGTAATAGSSAGGTSGSSATSPVAATPAARAPARSASAHVPQIERKIAVLFGINDYADKTIPPLENAVPDVDAVSTLFADKLGYEVRVVRNPTRADIIRTLNQLSVEINSTDSVVIYYAGHGYSLEKNGAGYWLPADAQASDPAKWISNGDVARLLSGIRSSQMVLISDSCYSGAFARDGMAAVGHDVTPEGVLAKRSVVVISSGGDEPVADEGKAGHSIFAWNLMEAMRSVSNWKPGSSVFNDVQAGVRKEFPQTPKYGSVTAAGHQAGGDYLFELR